MSSVAHVYSWLRAGLLANFENRLLGRTVSADWIGVALTLVGIGIALLPLADQFNFLKPYAVPGGVALILAGLLLCLVPIWKRIQARREAKPRACAAPAPIRSPMTFKPEPPQPSPYVHRVVPMFLFRRIVRPDGNAQKSMTAPENRRRPNVAKGAIVLKN